MPTMIENMNAKTITPANGRNPRQLYEHQEEALRKLDAMDKKGVFRTLLVLPTGGGKTLTAAYWLLRNAVDNGKKILWLAHRHLLLEQAAEAFALNAYTDNMVNRTVFSYRIISGMHDKPVHIKKTDNIIIAGKDSIVRNLDRLRDWLNGEEIYLVIDEAHHAVAKSYKKIIKYVEENAKSTKLLGLTATPFRTSEDEQGALKQVFTDDIVYKTDLDTLIKKGILATPVFDEYKTDIQFTEHLGINALKNIENLDIIPEDIAEDIAGSKERNSIIVNKYFENYKKYGPTIVFALNINHAIALNALFNEKGKQYGIKSEFIISSVHDAITGITLSNKENEEKIEKYRNGEIQVLINVNILTEGTDLPKTHTVFLTRPTVSTTLMTQMVGRALRGLKAGGTKEAYVVSFVDDWNDKIAWVNPETLTEAEYHEKETDIEKRNNNMRLVSIAKMEEFALMADASVDTSALDSISAIERIPLGMYVFSTFECNHQILIYSSTQAAYRNLIKDLPNIMCNFAIEDEIISEYKLESMKNYCINEYFDEHIIPSCNPKDIESLLKFYAQKEVEPLFITFDEIDRKKLDVSDIAKKIYDEDMRRSEKNEYIQSIWNEKGSIIPIYYTNLYFFKKMVDIELDKLDGDIQVTSMEPQSEAELRDLEQFPLQKIIEMYPKIGLELKENAYAAARNADGYYVCAGCGEVFRTREFLQIDHITPMAKGGLTVAENLQVLCRACNMRKGDRDIADFEEYADSEEVNFFDDEEDSFETYCIKAESGDAEAQWRLGFCYENGYGVVKDYKKAFEWYKKSAEQGNTDGIVYLGLCYENGNGVNEDPQKAAELYMKAAVQGDEWGQYNIGVCYENGYGVVKDHKKAVEWYSKAAEQGNASAQSNLGWYYDRKRDYNMAVEWFTKAAENGDADAQNVLGYCYEIGKGVDKDEKMAIEWYSKAAEQGSKQAETAIKRLKGHRNDN